MARRAERYCLVCGRVTRTGLCASHRHYSPVAQLRLGLNRAKAVGKPFGDAWERAIDRIVWPHDKDSRDEWKIVLDETRIAWRDAYYGTRPQRSMEAAAAMAPEVTDDLKRAAVAA